MEMALGYDFTVTISRGHRLGRDQCQRQRRPYHRDRFCRQAEEFSDWQVAKLAFAYPLLTLKVIACIDWEALCIWMKGVGLKSRPHNVEQTRTVVPRSIEQED